MPRLRDQGWKLRNTYVYGETDCERRTYSRQFCERPRKDAFESLIPFETLILAGTSGIIRLNDVLSEFCMPYRPRGEQRAQPRPHLVQPSVPRLCSISLSTNFPRRDPSLSTGLFLIFLAFFRSLLILAIYRLRYTSLSAFVCLVPVRAFIFIQRSGIQRFPMQRR